MRALLERFARRFRRRDIPAPSGDVYLERYYIYGWTREADFGVALHRLLLSDEDREVHNHPWGESVSIILAGGYHEEFLGADGKIHQRVLQPGDVNVITANHFHRVELLEKDCWSLFIMGKRTQGWGFKSRDGSTFTPWRRFLESKGIPMPYDDNENKETTR